MSGLRGIVRDIQAQAVKQGGSLSAKARKALRRHRTTTSLLGIVVTVAAVAVLVVTAYVALQQAHEPKNIRVAAGGLGITVGGALLALNRIWKETSQTGLLLALVEDAREDQVQDLIDRLAKKL